MKPGVQTRRSAATAVGRVLRSGAYSNRLIDTAAVRGKDADLFRFLIYTTLRHLIRIDAVIEQYSAKKPASLDGEVVDTLRVAVAELLYGRAPTHAVVDSAVEAIKAGSKGRASGFVNGVLRSIARNNQAADATNPRDEYPDWLVDALDDVWDAEDVTGFLVASLREAPRQVRARPGVDTTSLAPVPEISDAYEWEHDGEIPGGFAIQDAASVAVGNAVPAGKGDLVLDMAASPGGKAAHLRDRGFVVIAADRNLRRAKMGSGRVGEIPWVCADGRTPPFRSSSFDHVLLDAPCSGLGTMRRRPEVRYRTDSESVARMGDLQRSLLDAALSLVKPGGTVTYSVCTVTPEETVAVVDGYAAQAPFDAPGTAWGNGVLLGPHLTGTDGMFISTVSRS